jgi:LemA protein
MKKFIIIGVVLAVIVIIVFISNFNKAAELEEQAKKSWGNVENVLQRRYDLIPNLVETVKGYAQHEKTVFTDIAKSRENYFQASSPEEKIKASGDLERSLSRLLMLTETYPDLKANENFMRLQDELAGTENRIAVERRRYNESAEELRNYGRSFLGSIFVGIRGIDLDEYEYFKADAAAKTAPKVKF